MTGQDRDARIVVRTIRWPNQAVIEIQDNGPGISPEDLGKIFKPFYRSSTSNGVGLGLATAYSIVRDSYGGMMRAESKSGKGVKIIIELPYEGSS